MTCGKNHDGVCNKLKNIAFAGKLNSSGKPNWNKKAKLYVAQYIAQKVSEAIADDSESEVEVRSKKQRPK